MVVLLASSLVLRVLATVWGGILAFRYRDWRIGAFAAAVGLSIVEAAIDLYTHAYPDNKLQGSGFPESLDVAVGLLCFGAAIAGHRVLIRERRERERLRTSSEVRARRFAEGREDGVWSVDTEGQTTYVNRAMGELLRRAPEDLLGRNWLELLPADRHKELKEALAQLPENPAVLENVTLQPQQGPLIWVRIHLSSLEAEDGRREGYVASMSDVTPQRVSNLARAARQNLLERMARGIDLRELLSDLSKDLTRGIPNMECRFRTVEDDGRSLLLAKPSPAESPQAEPTHQQDGQGPAHATTPERIPLLEGSEAGPVTQHPASMVASSGRRCIIDNIDGHLEWPLAHGELRRAGLRSGWIEPIRGSAGRVIGTLEHYLSEVREPRAEELALGETVAQLAGLAIERCRTEAALERARMLLEATLEGSQAGILVVNADDLSIRIANGAARRLMQDGAGERPPLVGVTVPVHYASLEACLPDGTQIAHRDMPLMRSLIDGETCRDQEIVLHLKDREPVCMLVNTSPLLAADGRIEAAVAVFLDVTTRKQAESTRKEALERLATQNQELEEIFRATSHDLRSPLVNIEGFGGEIILALDELRGLLIPSPLPGKTQAQVQQLLEEEIPEALNFVKSSTQKMNRLLRGLSAVSRYGGAELKIAPVAMTDLVQRVVAELSFQIQQAGASVTVDELIDCDGDADEVAQVFTNLIDNALKYLVPHQPGVVRVSSQRRGDQVEYRVTDNGIGIEERHQKRVFETFRRLNPEGPVGGEGLGLSILSRIVDRHGGEVGLESTPKVGSTFWVSFPACTKATARSES